MTMRKVRAGETIIKEGDLGDEMYIVDRSAQHSTPQNGTERHSNLCHGLQFQLSHFTMSTNVNFYLIPFYVINQSHCISGSFNVLKRDDSGVSQDVFKYTSSGSAFGELSLMYRQRRAATVRALTDGDYPPCPSHPSITPLLCLDVSQSEALICSFYDWSDEAVYVKSLPSYFSSFSISIHSVYTY